jgi:hypothetical protein
MCKSDECSAIEQRAAGRIRSSGCKGVIMEAALPDITYNLSNPRHERYRSIEVNGEVVHWIEDIDKFYQIFGYSADMRKAGVLPEEFIWNEYTRKSPFDFTACKLIQIIEYLRVHSHLFLQKYGKECEKWLAELVKLRAARHEVCTTCKMKPVCSN